MAEHEHGSMYTGVQEKTFSGFIKTVKWSSILIVVFLVFLAMVNG